MTFQLKKVQLPFTSTSVYVYTKKVYNFLFPEGVERSAITIQNRVVFLEYARKTCRCTNIHQHAPTCTKMHENEKKREKRDLSVESKMKKVDNSDILKLH